MLMYTENNKIHFKRSDESLVCLFYDEDRDDFDDVLDKHDEIYYFDALVKVLINKYNLPASFKIISNLRYPVLVFDNDFDEAVFIMSMEDGLDVEVKYDTYYSDE